MLNLIPCTSFMCLEMRRNKPARQCRIGTKGLLNCGELTSGRWFQHITKRIIALLLSKRWIYLLVFLLPEFSLLAAQVPEKSPEAAARTAQELVPFPVYCLMQLLVFLVLAELPGSPLTPQLHCSLLAPKASSAHCLPRTALHFQRVH